MSPSKQKPTGLKGWSSMKKLFAMMLVMVLVLSCFAGCETEKTVVVGYTNYAPMNYNDDSGKLVGFDTELAEAVFGAMGYKVIFKLIDWNAKYTDLESAKDSNTAYRLSWMNATKSEKVYSIVATFGNGEQKVIETIKMAPGTDGVATGIVEVAAGQNVKIVSRDDSQPEPEDDGTTPGGSSSDKNEGNNKGSKGQTGMLIAIIAIGVVFIGIIVAAILMLTKKKPEAKKES